MAWLQTIAKSFAKRFALTFVLIFLIASCAPQPVLQITNNRPIIKSQYHFFAEHWQQSYLKKLLRQEDFAKIQADSQFELFTKLCTWTNEQWKHSVPRPWPLDNAIDILRDIRSGKTGGWCGQFSYVLVDVLKARGFFSARYVEITGAQRSNSHFVVEVWSDQFQKWVVLDPDYNAYFKLVASGEPAGALEIRDSLFGGRPVEIVYNSAGLNGNGVNANGVKQRPTKVMTELFRNLAFSMRSDLMRERRFMDNRARLNSFLFFKDAHQDKPWKNKIPYKNITLRRDDINFDCNRVRVESHYDEERAVLTLEFLTDGSMMNFQRLVQKDRSSGIWKTLPQRLEIPRGQSLEHLRVAPQNQFKQRGQAIEINLTWQ